ncbi:MAG TPA: hypothetical protein VJI75_00290 [Candidatus Nanoarchaeia archaeon]|nr:hypothetical protein [Candidatus Nanoarchaeia archaeon]
MHSNIDDKVIADHSQTTFGSATVRLKQSYGMQMLLAFENPILEQSRQMRLQSIDQNLYPARPEENYKKKSRGDAKHFEEPDAVSLFPQYRS